MGKFFKSSTQESSSKQEQNPWAPTQDGLKFGIDELKKQFDSISKQGYISQTGDLSGIYADYMKGLQGNIANAQNQTKPFLDQASQLINQGTAGFQDLMQGKQNYTTQDIANGASPLINNELLQGQIDAAVRGDVRNFNENIMPGIASQANQSGNLNSSRTAIKEAIAQRSLDDRKADVAANMRGQAYNNALGMSQSTLNNNTTNFMNGLNGVNGQAGNLLNFSNNLLQSQQNALNPTMELAKIQELLQGNKQADLIGNRDFGMQQIQQYLNGLLPIAGLGGTTTGTQKTPGSSMFDKVVSGGSMVGSFFSDSSLKEDIKHVGKENGHNIYTWKWNKEANKLGLVGNSKGVIAQEVMKTNPEAVIMDKNGYYKVNYSAIGVSHE